jgi:hypothetical protein
MADLMPGPGQRSRDLYHAAMLCEQVETPVQAAWIKGDDIDNGKLPREPCKRSIQAKDSLYSA